MNTLRYKDYEGSMHVSIEGRCMHGKLLFVDDVITYEGKNFDELEAAFHEAVDDYLVFCAEVGKEPEKPYKGVFNVRVKPEIHRALAGRAAQSQQTLNEVVCKALESYLSQDPVLHTHHHVHEHVLKEQTKRVRWLNDADSRLAILEATFPACQDLSEADDLVAQNEELTSWNLLKTEQYGHC